MKTRRRRSSKCTRTNPFAIEKTPFKDQAENGINFDDCIFPKPQHILFSGDVRRLKGIKMSQIVKNILNVNVGVDCNRLLNQVLRAESKDEYLHIELKKLLKQNNRLDLYIRLSFQQVNMSTPKEDIFPRKVVFQMLHFIISHVVPLSLLGSKQNFKLFLKGVKKVVYGSHHQRFGLSSMVHGFKLSHVLWLHESLPSNSLRLHVLACLVKWLLLYVQNIIHKMWRPVALASKEIVFYEKVLWQKRMKDEIDSLVRSRSIRPIENEDLKEKVRHIGHTRFIVKHDGLRPITVFKKPSNAADSTLRQHARMLVSQFAHYSGSTNTFLSPRVDSLLQDGLLKIISCYPCPVTRPQYYFVKVDVKDAYGSIHHATLLQILDTVYQKTRPMNGDLEMRNVKLGRKTCVMFESPSLVMPPNVIKGSKIKDAKIEPVLRHIRDYIAFLGTSISGQVYRIRHGIPQGMHLSSALCELYYSSLDSKHLKEFQETEKDEVFIRYCDDYLFLTPHKERAEKFLTKTHVYFSCEHVRFNAAKTLTNLYSPVLTVAFCGYSVDINMFNLQSNFLSYKNTNIVHSFDLSKTKNPGRIILQRMKIVLKLHPALLDKRINSKLVAVTNIYQASLLLAFRFYAYVNCYIPAGNLNPNLVLQCIKKGQRIIKNRVFRGVAKSCAGEWLSQDEIRLVVFKAFIARILKGGGVHQYPKILVYLKVTCSRISIKLKPDQLQLIESVSNPPLPAIFQTMK